MKDIAKKTVIVVRGQGQVTIAEVKGEGVLRKGDKVSSSSGLEEAKDRADVTAQRSQKGQSQPQVGPTSDRKEAASSEKGG